MSYGWTKEQIKTVKKIMRSGGTYASAAKSLDKTIGAVSLYCSKNLGGIRKLKNFKCVECGKKLRPRINVKRCSPCRIKRAKNPLGVLTPEQERVVREFAGTMKIKDLAKLVGTSDSTLDRWAKQNGVNINWLQYRKEEVEKVIAFYEKNGRKETEKKFPDVRVRSIVEKHERKVLRCQKWKAEEIVEAIRMAGLIPFAAQARYFNRPRANAGSVKALWVKKIGMMPGRINGTPMNVAKNLCLGSVPYRKIASERRHLSDKDMARMLVLWVDIEEKLRPDLAPFMIDAIKSLAEFQRWAHGAKNNKDCRKKISTLIRERS